MKTIKTLTNDLTRGKPMKIILWFTLPILIGNIFQQLYSMVDALIVGRTISMQALAAVGATGAISFLVIGFVQGITSGLTVITAQYYGAHNYDAVRRSIAMSIILSVGITVVVTIVSVLTVKPLLRLMNTPQDIFNDAYNYIVVIYYGIAATVFYNLFSCIIRALGDSRTPLYFLILASVINVALDLLFIIVFKMGVAGAGWATVISQGVSGALCFVYSLYKFPIMRLKKSDWKFNWKFAWKHLCVGLPMAFQFSITAIGVMAIQAVLNGFGSITVAAYTAANKIENLVTQTLFSLGSTMATYSAQNYGALNIPRIKQGIRCSLLLCLIFSVIAVAIILGAGKYLIMLFISDTDAALIEQVINEGQLYLIINSSCYFLLGLVFIYRCSLQGIGRSGATVFAGVAELAMRVVAAFVFAKIWGYIGVCIASPIAWLGADVLLLSVYYWTISKYNKKYPYPSPPPDLDPSIPVKNEISI